MEDRKQFNRFEKLKKRVKKTVPLSVGVAYRELLLGLRSFVDDRLDEKEKDQNQTYQKLTIN